MTTTFIEGDKVRILPTRWIKRTIHRKIGIVVGWCKSSWYKVNVEGRIYLLDASRNEFEKVN
jgi:hypothetical protein